MSQVHRFIPVPANLLVRQLTTQEDMEWVLKKIKETDRHGAYSYDEKTQAIIKTTYRSAYGDEVDVHKTVYLKIRSWIAWFEGVGLNVKPFSFYSEKHTPATIAADIKPFFRYIPEDQTETGQNG